MINEDQKEDQKKVEIARQYGEFFDKALDLANKDLDIYPLSKNEVKRDRFEKHLIGMVEMHFQAHMTPEKQLAEYALMNHENMVELQEKRRRLGAKVAILMAIGMLISGGCGYMIGVALNGGF